MDHLKILSSINAGLNSQNNALLTDHRHTDFLQRVNYRLLESALFRVAPGSATKHHCETGGLIAHTYEVVQACADQADTAADLEVKLLSWPILFTAALWHDYGKIWDYEHNPQYTMALTAPGALPRMGTNGIPVTQRWMKTPHRTLIRHVTRSYSEFNITCRETQPREEWSDGREKTLEQIGHCILAHHGRLEYGSPVEPETPEAWALHLADMISVRVFNRATET